MKDLILEVKNITKEVNSPEGALTIVQDVNLSIAEGELVSLVGPSGSGKTTLLAIMAGLDLPSQGSVTLLGAEITSLDEDKRAQIRGNEVGFVFQSFHLMPKLSALDNVMLPLEISGSDDAQSKAKEALIKVGLEKRVQHFPTQLSGGEKQRVAIARAMINEPKILFADEPTGNLDSQTGHDVMQLFHNLHNQGQTIILITHENEVAAEAQRTIFIKDGLIESDTTKEKK